MKVTATIIAIVAALAFAGNAIATMPGKTAEFEGGPMGKVVFDGKFHADQGLACGDCHTAIFQMQRVAKVTMADHNEGKLCFTCHKDGGRSFTSANNCARCHKK